MSHGQFKELFGYLGLTKEPTQSRPTFGELETSDESYAEADEKPERQSPTDERERERERGVLTLKLSESSERGQRTLSMVFFIESVQGEATQRAALRAVLELRWQRLRSPC